MNSLTVPRFWSMYRQLPEDVRRAAREAYQLFRTNAAHPRLRFH